jgi:hypothetical protein
MTHSRLPLTLVALAAILCHAAPAAAGHQVVLKDGSRIAASTRPVIALGRVNFNDLDGRSRSLSAATVDLSGTREALRRTSASPVSTVWTAADLEAAHSRVRLETARSAGAMHAQARAPAKTSRHRRSATEAQIDLAQKALINVETQRRFLKSDDREAGILDLQKIHLQSDLLRLETAREIEVEESRVAQAR